MALRWLGLAVIAAVAAGGAEAGAAPKPSYGAPPSWVDVAPIPAPAAAEGAPALQLLLDDNQSRLSPSGDVFYTRRAVKVLKPEALSDLTNESVVWDPVTEDVAIHTLAIIRDGKDIDLLHGGKKVLVLRRETGLEAAMLDGRLSAIAQIEGLQVGDVLDFAWTLTRHDPVMKGHSQDPEGLSGLTAGRYRVRISWPNNHPVRWKASEGLPKLTVSNRDGRTELLIDALNAKAPDAPLDSPARYHWLARLDASSFSSWSEASAMVAPLFDQAAKLAPDSPLRAEAAAIASRASDPKARAFEALKLVESKTRYFFIGTNDGGYVPATADETWTRRFGDCKGKTVLLLSLLRQLGVQAEPALVSTSRGDGLDQTEPSLLYFDHVIVRATIGGKVYWMDGTREGDVAGMEALRPPSWEWALPLRPGGAELERIVEPPLDQPMVEMNVRIDATKGMDAPAPTHMKLRLRGDAAVSFRQLAARAGKEELQKAFRRTSGASFDWFRPRSLDWKDDAAQDAMDLMLDGDSELDWRENPDVHAREFKLSSGSTDVRTFPRREPGPNDDAPFAVSFPFYVRGVFEVQLPQGGAGFSVRGLNVDKTIAGYEIHRASAMDGEIARFTASIRSVANEISAREAESGNKAFRDLLAEPELIRAAAEPQLKRPASLH